MFEFAAFAFNRMKREVSCIGAITKVLNNTTPGLLYLYVIAMSGLERTTDVATHEDILAEYLITNLHNVK